MTAVRETVSVVVCIVVVVTVVFVNVCAGEDGGTLDDVAAPAPDSRSLRKEIVEDQWKAVENVQIETSGWVPDYNTPQRDEPLPKRRRLRKRKRRPQITSITNDSEIAANHYPVRRNKRPQHLHEIQDLWTQMEADGKTKPNNRRRIFPPYQENPFVKQNRNQINDEIEVPQADQGLHKMKTSTEAVPDLRAILKKTGGLSLSEILQQKNLSLSDLLKGEKEAILAITEKPENQVITEYKNPVEDDLPKRTKFSSNYRVSSASKPYVNKEDIVTNTNPLGVSEMKIYQDSTHRVSIKPNNVIVVDFKPSLIGLDIVRKQDDPIETATRSSTVKSNHLPITSAKLNKLLKPTAKIAVENEVYPTTLPPKAFKINIDELFGISNLEQQGHNETDEGPLKMSFDLNSYVENPAKTAVEATTLEMFPEKLKTITAKDEILEVLEDEETKMYLKKILEVRNMTFEDLVELRERGSSQKHLADLFHNKTKEPEPKEKPLIVAVKTEIPIKKNYEAVISTAKKEIPINRFQLERQPKSYFSPLESTDSDGDRYVALVEPIEESNESKSIEETKDKEKYIVTSFPTYKIELDKKFKEKPPTPMSETWKSNYPDVFNDLYKRTHQKGIVEDLSENYFDELRTIDEVENAIAESGHEKLNVEAHKETYEDTDDDGNFIKLPYGVKHAILASLLIIGISLVIFLTILMIFKWSQRHKKKLCYNGSFSCSKIKSPILNGNPERRSFRSFMSDTLGRKKRYYKQHLQSVSDAIWDNDRKPF